MFFQDWFFHALDDAHWKAYEMHHERVEESKRFSFLIFFQ
jgi:hypothetical protein